MTTLVLGYGNTLRSDDGVGVQVAAAVAAWHQPQFQTLAVHQLTPDLAAAIAPFLLVIFVDATVAAGPDAAIAFNPLDLSSSETFTTHIASPTALLALAQRLYDARPTAYLLTIPGVNFELGEGLSETATAGKAQALELLRELCLDNVEERFGRLGAALAKPNRVEAHVGLPAVSPNRGKDRESQIFAAPQPPILGEPENSRPLGAQRIAPNPYRVDQNLGLRIMGGRHA
ncbi:MAG: hydrogenase maturation protease [Leptolyngbya sp. RL_3_1]|nr:hydrogenase maturation protease [Leptolyngbya sp. RL_3_1]